MFVISVNSIMRGAIVYIIALGTLIFAITCVYGNPNGSEQQERIDNLLQKYADDLIDSRLGLNNGATNRKSKAAVDVMILMDQASSIANNSYNNDDIARIFKLSIIYKETLEKLGKVVTPEQLKLSHTDKSKYPNNSTSEFPSDKFLFVRYAFISRNRSGDSNLDDIPVYQGTFTRFPNSNIVNEYTKILNVTGINVDRRENYFTSLSFQNPYPEWIINILGNNLLFTGKTWEVQPTSNAYPFYECPFWDINNLRILIIYTGDLMDKKFHESSLDYYKIQMLEEIYSKIASEQHIITIAGYPSNISLEMSEEIYDKGSNSYVTANFRSPADLYKLYYPSHKLSKIFTAFSSGEIDSLKTDIQKFGKITIKHGFNLEMGLDNAVRRAIEENFHLLNMNPPIADKLLYENIGTPQSALSFTRLPFEEEGLYASDHLLSYQRKTPPNIYTFGDYDILESNYGSDGYKLDKILDFNYGTSAPMKPRGLPFIIKSLIKAIENTSYLIYPSSKQFDCLALVYANKFVTHAYKLANNYIEKNYSKEPIRKIIKPFYVEPVFIISAAQAEKCSSYIDYNHELRHGFQVQSMGLGCPYFFVVMKAVFEGMDNLTALPKMKIRLEVIDDACDYNNEIYGYPPLKDVTYHIPYTSCVKPDPYMHPFGIRTNLENIRVVNLMDLAYSEDNARNIDYSMVILEQNEDPDDFFVYSCEVSKCKNYYLKISEDVDEQNESLVFDEEHYNNTKCPNEGVVIPRTYSDILVKPYVAISRNQTIDILRTYVGDDPNLDNYKDDEYKKYFNKYVFPNSEGYEFSRTAASRKYMFKSIYDEIRSPGNLLFKYPKEYMRENNYQPRIYYLERNEIVNTRTKVNFER